MRSELQKIANAFVPATAGALGASGWGAGGAWLPALAAAALLGYRLAHSPSIAHASRDGALFGSGLACVAVVDAIGALLVASEFPALVAYALGLFYLALAALSFGLASALVKNASSSGNQYVRSALLFAGAMTLSEWVRVVLLPEQAATSIGYLLLDTPLAGLAPIGGLHSVSFAGFALAFSLQCALTDKRARKRHFVVSAGWLLIGAVCAAMPWVRPSGPSLSFRLIASDLSLSEKSRAESSVGVADVLAQLLEKPPVGVVAIGETTFSKDFHQLPPNVSSLLHSFSRKSGSHILFGATRTSPDGHGYNSVFHISPDDSGRVEVIDKRLLMPVGEYLPVTLSWLIPKELPFVKDLASGAADQAPFSLRAATIGVVICREELTGELARSWASKTSLVVNPSNLAWFSGDRIASRELQIVRMRALEVGRPFLRVTNKGGAASIDAFGQIREALPPGATGVLSGLATPMGGQTPFVRFGNWPIVLLCVAAILECVLSSIERRLPRSHSGARAAGTGSTQPGSDAPRA